MVCSHCSRLRSIRGRKTCRKQQEERDRKAQNGKRGEGQLVTSIFEVLMHTEGEEEAVEKEAPPAV